MGMVVMKKMKMNLNGIKPSRKLKIYKNKMFPFLSLKEMSYLASQEIPSQIKMYTITVCQ